jgi:hypothetical protein
LDLKINGDLLKLDVERILGASENP